MEAIPHAADRDDLLVVLAKEEYREILSELRARPDDVTSLTDLADGGHAHASGGTATAIRLHHVLLPRLDDVGLVDYDSIRHTVRYQASERAEAWLDDIQDGRDVW